MSELMSIKLQEPSSCSGGSLEDDSRPITPVKLHGNAVEAEVDEEDSNLGPDKELIYKLQCLKKSMTPKMLKLIEDKRHEIDSEPLLENENEAERRGISFKLLRELKVAFESVVSSSGLPGVDEHEFLELFGEHLCSGMSEEETRHWFRCVDKNCSGSIQWSEITQYLIGFNANPRPTNKNYFVDRTMEPAGKLVTRRKHHKPISKIIYSKDSDTYYTASHDGFVFCWHPTTFKVLQEVHGNHICIEAIVFLPHNQRLLVLQADRCLFIYDCFMRENVLCHELNRVYATKGHTTKTLSDGNNYYSPVTKEDLQGDPHTVHFSALSDRALPSMVLCTLLHPSKGRYTCVDHLGGGLSAGEPVVLGTDIGTLETLVLISGGNTPLKVAIRVSVHKGIVTMVQYAPELGGTLSSSTDHSVALTDVEKGIIIQRIRLHERSRPVYAFDYHTYHNTLLTWGGRELHLWNALTGAKLSSFTEHESSIVAAVLNMERMHVYVLTESSMVKVWDIKTWKSIGEFYDMTTRYPNNRLSFAHWSKEHHMFVSGCGELFGLRSVDVQERIDAGLRASNSGYVGHMHPIRASRMLETAGHIVSMDLKNVGVWGFASKQLLSLWHWNSPTDNITCFDPSKDQVKVLIGTEEGKVGWYNYACGFRMYGLRHKKGTVAVNAVLVLSDVAANLPEMGVAALGNSIYGWPSNKLDADVRAPTDVFDHRDPDALAMCLAVIDSSRQFIACGFSNSEVRILSYSLAPIFSLAVALPIDRICPIMKGAFLGTHNDGYVTLFGLDPRSYDLHALCSVHCSHVEEEHVTCLSISGNLLIVGDNLGVVSIFDFGNLLDPTWLQAEVLAALQEKVCTKTVQNALKAVKLVSAFDVHEGAVTGLSIHIGEIITSGGDRQLRSWSIEHCTLVTEYGMHDPNMQPFYSFNVSAEHAFHRRDKVVKGQSKLLKQKVTRTLSFTKRGSILGVELRKKRMAKLEVKQAVQDAKPKKGQPVSVTGLGLATDDTAEIPRQHTSSSSSDESSDGGDTLPDPLSGMQDFMCRARYSSFVFGGSAQAPTPQGSPMAPQNQSKTPQPTRSSLGQHIVGLTPPPTFNVMEPRSLRLPSLGPEARAVGITVTQSDRPTAVSRKFSMAVNMTPSIRDNGPRHLPALPMLNYEKPPEMELFKLATDRIIKIRQSLSRVIPDVSTHQKLQEVMRIREERLNEEVKSSGIFYRLDMLNVRDVVARVQQSTGPAVLPAKSSFSGARMGLKESIAAAMNSTAGSGRLSPTIFSDTASDASYD